MQKVVSDESTQLRLAYKKNGYVHIKDALSLDEVATLRKALDLLSLQFADRRMLTIGEILKHPDIYKIQFNKKIINAVKSIFLDPNYINDIQIQINTFGNMGSTQGWHLDCGSEIADTSNLYLYEKSYEFAKIGVYFQDNTFDLGGGIDFKPGMHRVFTLTKNVKINFFLAKIFGRLVQKYVSGRMAPISAGSVVIFDSRLPHRSSPPHKYASQYDPNAGRSNIEMAYSKYVLYWEVCGKRFSEFCIKNHKKRSILEENRSTELFFTEYLSHGFPEDYPVDYVDLVKANGVPVASLGVHESNMFKEILNYYHISP